MVVTGEVLTESITKWIAAFPSDEAQREIAKLEQRRDELDRQIGRMRKLLEIAASVGVDKAPRPTSGEKPQGMDAVERVMRTRPGTWKRRDIHRELLRLGWIAEGEAGRHTLGSIMNRMVERERVIRAPGTGCYRLPDVSDHQEVIAA